MAEEKHSHRHHHRDRHHAVELEGKDLRELLEPEEKSARLHSQHRPHRSSSSSRRLGRAPKLRLSSESRDVALLVFFATLLLLSPIFIFQRFTNLSLRKQLEDLRIQHGNLMTFATPERAAAAAKAEAAAKAAAEAAAEAERYRVAHPLRTKFEMLRAVRKANALEDLPHETIAGLTNSISLMPNGRRGLRARDGSVTQMNDPLTQQIILAYGMLRQENWIGAKDALDKVVAAQPHWPYGRYYHAIVSGNVDEMFEAERLFAALREMKILSPDVEIYHALTLLFLQEYTDADDVFWQLTRSIRGSLSFNTGPLFMPQSTPENFRDTITRIKNLGDVVMLKWPPEEKSATSTTTTPAQKSDGAALPGVVPELF